MELDYLATVLLSSLSSASILLIATLGLAVVFGLMGVINLAHGEFLMLGAYSALTATQLGVPYPLAVPLAVMVTMAFGAVVEVVIVRRLYGRIFDTMLATWGLSIAMYQLAVLIFGTVTPGIGMPQYRLEIGDYKLAAYPLSMIAVAILVTLFIYMLMTKSSYGRKARAAIQQPEMARAIGIESARINTLTFSIGCGLAGFAGAILLPIVPATPSMGFAFVIKSFLAVVVAGPVTVTGSLVTALGLGGGSSITASFLTSVAGDVFFFVITAGLLWLFPLGISSKWRKKM
ncbi:putative Amino acid or sugar ABC transport system, permease protein [Vibrio nigripulchritudo MADA3029]|uniref:branched-chain amino acid ABC transporter permease n=1 Tax=Vibrio nigripulchritudo TaxID=28173 RepID=UPI0003B1C6A5|nr:branched-chain amino acid ABC transporter permease [Vibrio nigripulchritudo]CCN50891.1 putative Amino acid or sugar ABC transport system, permease protein [Vibrio nigripulchritudo MADA3020]CCN56749.1 putative Amino acid or sugar ABC transport system, permease protein [Vibrio nigripulchritudo MADA3021]CCN62606.1 putative Amino acid or sugar ABC transport system, permease protein [Vibrio nigripulchritudo MADA3029]